MRHTKQYVSTLCAGVGLAVEAVPPGRKVLERIRHLPTMPKFTYSHTCPKCGCHLATPLLADNDSTGLRVQLCLYCHHAYGATEVRST